MLKGIDISKWQATTPSLAGLSFAFARATYGSAADFYYAKHMAAFRAAGIVAGAYAFGNGRSTGHEQAVRFLMVAKDADLLALDLESDGPSGVSMTKAQAADFIRTVHEAGRKIGLYHSDSSFPSLGQNWNWVAKWGSTPPARPWAIWQWQGSPLDKDYFNGTIADLHLLAGIAPDTQELPLILRANSLAYLPTRGDVAAGTQFYRLGGEPLTKMSKAGTVTSVGQTGEFEIVVITTAGVTQYALLRTTDFRNAHPVVTATVTALQSKIAAAKAALA